jgi:glycogen operon protein
MRHPEVPYEARGTFAGLSHPSVVSNLGSLGVSAIELLPVHAFINDRHLAEKGLANYWGYNSIGYFAPHPAYFAKGGLSEFKTFVQVMHDAGIEVLLDVVYNHTAEGNHLGPTLCFRGIDNRSYYYLVQEQERYYNDFTGTGNALELRHPQVLRMVTDSLRYWVQEMHVDGFRFDLASTLARVNGEFDRHAGFLDVVAQDPVLSEVKLIAEPWDTGPEGYQMGNFPPPWAEWNDRYRDTVRRFWKGDSGQVAELASRVSGSSDLFDYRGRRPWASINFVTAHDGFTLRDLVSYNQKHNEANQEGNADGTDENHSWNCGVEGHTDDPEIQALRLKQMKNMLASLLFSQGVPMITAGDELGKSQEGNNNAYCQDNELSWIDWSLLEEESGRDLWEFTQSVLALRNRHIVFRRSRFFRGRTIPGTDVKDVTWLTESGAEMTAEEWHDEERRFLAFYLSGEAGLKYVTTRGEPEPDESFLVLMNGSDSPLSVALPEDRGAQWREIINTGSGNNGVPDENGLFGEKPRADGSVPARSFLLLLRESES